MIFYYLWNVHILFRIFCFAQKYGKHGSRQNSSVGCFIFEDRNSAIWKKLYISYLMGIILRYFKLDFTKIEAIMFL